MISKAAARLLLCLPLLGACAAEEVPGAPDRAVLNGAIGAPPPAGGQFGSGAGPAAGTGAFTGEPPGRPMDQSANDNAGGGWLAPPESAVAQPNHGQECREYQISVLINGQPQRGFGTACREADGTWRIVP